MTCDSHDSVGGEDNSLLSPVDTSVYNVGCSAVAAQTVATSVHLQSYANICGLREVRFRNPQTLSSISAPHLHADMLSRC